MVTKRIAAFTMLSFVVSFFLAFDVSCQTNPTLFKVRKEDSHVGFSLYKWLVIKEEGRFKDFDGTILYDPQNPSRTSVEFSVKTESVDSRNEGRDRALRSREFFNPAEYPVMTFKSVSVSPKGKNDLLIDGDLTIRGVKRRVTVPVKVLGISYAGREVGSVAGFESTFTLNREDFGVGAGWNILGKEVTINLLIGANNNSLASTR